MGTTGSIEFEKYHLKANISKEDATKAALKHAKSTSKIDYQETIYFEGNFNETYLYLKRRLKKNDPPQYSLFLNTYKKARDIMPDITRPSFDPYDYGINCMQLVARALRKGDWDNYRNKMLKEKLREAELEPRPNKMYEKIAKFVKSDYASLFPPTLYVTKPK